MSGLVADGQSVYSPAASFKLPTPILQCINRKSVPKSSFTMVLGGCDACSGLPRYLSRPLERGDARLAWRERAVGDGAKIMCFRLLDYFPDEGAQK